MRIGIVGAEYRQYQGKPDDLTYRTATFEEEEICRNTEVIAHLHPVVMIALLSGALINRYIFLPSDAPCIRPTYRKAMNSSLSEVTVAMAGNLIILPLTRTLSQREKTVRFGSQNEVRSKTFYIGTVN